MSKLVVVPTPEAGPIETEARAMFERVLAKKPTAVYVWFETTESFSDDWFPHNECTRIGLVHSLVREMYEDGVEAGAANGSRG